LCDEVMDRAVRPTLAELARRGAPFRGVLFCGLMLTAGGPKVVEYNVRFGDPECQVLVPRFASDLYVHLRECAAGAVQTPIALAPVACVGVAMAAAGYPPTAERRGDPIEGLDRAAARFGVQVFHSGTALDDSGRVVTAGGRILTVVGTGPTVHAAHDAAYAAAADITWAGVHYRRDIAAQALT
jgi:phosphoribosylamine--glycine ligase